MRKHIGLTLALLAAGATAAAPGAEPQSALPGNGAAQHPFLYAGEWDTRKPLEQSIFIVRGGKVVWQYSIQLRTATDRIQEIDRSEEHTSLLHALSQTSYVRVNGKPESHWSSTFLSCAAARWYGSIPFH